jgi:hypothetical protein
MMFAIGREPFILNGGKKLSEVHWREEKLDQIFGTP